MLVTRSARGGPARSPVTSLTAPDRKPGSRLATTALPARSRQGQREGTRGGHPGEAAGACAWPLPRGDVLAVPRSPHAARAAPSALPAAAAPAGSPQRLPPRCCTAAAQGHRCSAVGRCALLAEPRGAGAPRAGSAGTWEPHEPKPVPWEMHLNLSPVQTPRLHPVRHHKEEGGSHW